MMINEFYEQVYTLENHLVLLFYDLLRKLSFLSAIQQNLPVYTFLWGHVIVFSFRRHVGKNTPKEKMSGIFYHLFSFI